MKFPKKVSFTLTNRCNLQCAMCGQWGSKGTMKKRALRDDMLPLEAWLKAVDEIADHPGTILMLRGGEPFLYPHIARLITYVKKRKIPLSVDTNGTLLGKYGEKIVRAGVDHLNISIDGPEEIHDRVRGMKGCFEKIKWEIKELRQWEKKANRSVGKTLCFTISPGSLPGLSAMPDTARQLGIGRIALVPYYYFHPSVVKRHARIMRGRFGCEAVSVKGFERNGSGISGKELEKAFRAFYRRLGRARRARLVPFMNYSISQYKEWFQNSQRPVDDARCSNPWNLADIQPRGDVNFCIDFPDYVIGNITQNSLEEIWRSGRAEKFRNYILSSPLPVCARCGAKYC